MNHPRIKSSRAIGALSLSLSLGLFGCALPDLEQSTSALQSGDALSPNHLTHNSASYAKLAEHRLSEDQLPDGRFAFNALDNDIHETSAGRDLVRFATRCALADGDTLIVDLEGDTVEYPGSFGLAEAWVDEPLSQDGQSRISACMIAHVNAFGVGVPLSFRLVSGRRDQNNRIFSHYEGAFFGNLFNESEGPAYSCYGQSPPTRFDVRAGDRMLRLCAGETCGRIESLGSCQSICQDSMDDSFNHCAVPDGHTDPIHVWLLRADAEDSVWTEHVRMLLDHWGKPTGPTQTNEDEDPIANDIEFEVRNPEDLTMGKSTSADLRR